MDDLISRAAAIDAIDCWHIDFNSMDGAKVQTDCWRTIKELPAVDAIPVKWLRSQLKNNPNDIESAYDDICINELIDRWQKEQEAR